jgi:hypothetical protein
MYKQIKLLLTIKKLLTIHNIDFWLAYGTLLGAIREGSFLQHDTCDIDIGLNIKDYWKVRNLLDSHPYLKYKNVWRTELCIYLDEGVHLDLFFYEEKGEKMYTNAYLRNKKQGGANIESNMQYKKDNIYPLRTINFYGNDFKIPNNPEEHLIENYGEWEIQDTSWCHTKLQALNPDHRTIGILIPTFLRDDKMIKSVKSIIECCEHKDAFRKWIRIYVGDQGYANFSVEKKEFYKKLEEEGHKVYNLPFNCGLSFARNFLVKESLEPYLMIVDDDFDFTSNTNLGVMIDVLNHKKENGIVGGDIDNRAQYHADLVLEKDSNGINLYRIKKHNTKQIVAFNNSYVDYYYTGIVLNFFLAKREVLEDVPLDNNLKLVEHTDHFLRIKRDSEWKVCHCPLVTCSHIQGQEPKEYKDFRQNEDYVSMFKNKWGIKKIIRVDEAKHEDIVVKEQIEVNKKIKVVQIARIPCANSGYELSKLINEYSLKYESKYILGFEYSKSNNKIPFRYFPYELFWGSNPEACIDAIKEADIVHVHHDTWPDIVPYLKDKCVISTVYNLTNSLQYSNSQFNKDYLNKLMRLGYMSVADQPLQKKMFSDISKRHLPLVKMLFNYPVVKNDKITIGYAPTNQTDVGIGSKRFTDVCNIVGDLCMRYGFKFDLIEGIPYDENIERKSKCDIFIDDVDDLYEKAHNSTIEAGLLNAIPLTNYSGDWFPAIKTDVNTLKETLIDLLENPNKIIKYKQKLQEWREKVYTPRKLLDIYEKTYDDILNNPFKLNIPLETLEEPKVVHTSCVVERSVTLNIDNLLTELLPIVILLNKSCLEMVNNLTLQNKKLWFGYTIENKDAVINTLRLNGFIEKEPYIYINNDYIIYLQNYTRNIKSFDRKGLKTNVPYPVVGYLKSMFGNTWNKINLDK